MRTGLGRRPNDHDGVTSEWKGLQRRELEERINGIRNRMRVLTTLLNSQKMIDTMKAKELRELENVLETALHTLNR
jgi:hypothetical protein